MKYFITFICLSFLISLLELNEILPQTSFVNAIDFDGNGDYGNTFNNPYFPTINGTIEAWVKVRSISLPGGNQGEAFVAKNEEQWNNGDFYVFFDYSNGRLTSRVQKPPSIEVDVISNNNFWQSLNQWIHYAFTWGAGGMRMYINGVLQSNQNNFNYSALNNDYNFYVGAHGYKLHSGQYVVSDFFDGQIDELRIWNYQKSSQQINALKDAPLDSSYYNTVDSGLVGYWRFDVLEDLGVNNDGQDDVRDLSVLYNHLDLAGDAHLVMPDPVIPIELISFILEAASGKVKLSWATATELNNYGFEIERCSKEHDWRTIAFVEGKGTTTEIQHYTYVDDRFGIQSERLYYRLKQIDYNGKFAYSSELEVKTPPASFHLYQNYPNPFNPATVIKYSVPNTSHISLIIFDALGQQIKIIVDEIKDPGYYQVDFNASNLPNGIYFYTLSSDNFISTKKMILLK
jgi:hypothetical protein